VERQPDRSPLSGVVRDGAGGAAVAAFLEGHPLPAAVFERVWELVGDREDVHVRVGRSQLALRRRRGFAWLWLPGRYLHRPAAEVVLSVSLGRADPSPRWKEVVHPARAHWMHHLEVGDPAEIDGEVADWLREAAARAG
jgi:hypothetical protein